MRRKLLVALVVLQTTGSAVPCLAAADAQAGATGGTANASAAPARDKINDGSTFAASNLKTISGLTDSRHIAIVSRCNEQIESLSAQDKFAQALPCATQVLDIVQKDLGPMNLQVAAALNNIGWLQQGLGNYEQARRMFTRALTIAEKMLGSDHADLACYINNLACLSFFEGDYDQALSLYDRARVLSEKTFGEESANVALILKSTAGVLDAMGKKQEALSLYRKVLQINEKNLAPDSLDLADSLNDVACALQGQQQYGQAIMLSKRALAIREKNLGLDHPDIAESLNNLAMLEKDNGDPAAAVPLLKRALSIMEKTVGPEHLDVANILNNLGELAWLEHDLSTAQSNFLQAAEIINLHTQKILPALSLAQQHAFLESRMPSEVSRLLVACRGNHEFDSAYNLIFRWKGLLIDALARQCLLKQLSETSNFKPQAQRLQKVRSEIAGWYLEAGRLPYASWKTRNNALTAEKEALETELACALKSDSIKDVLANTSLSDLHKLLKPDEALVDLYLYSFAEPDGSFNEHYAAIVCSPARAGSQALLVDLGPAGAIESAADEWMSLRKECEPAELAWQKLSSLLWKPIAAALPHNANKIWLCPDSRLCRIPWQLVPAAGNFTGTNICQIDSVRELFHLRSNTGAASTSPDMLLVGGVNFDLSADMQKDPSSYQSQPFKLPALPGTLREVNEISKIARDNGLTENELLSSRATKAALISELPGKQFIHLATHGFFFNEEVIKKMINCRRAASDEKVSKPAVDTADNTGFAKRNPLIESGIALAGANFKEAKSGENPGLLTAEEMVGLDLSSCRLMVLSACDTAKGEEISGQGVMGLRAAIMAAGSKAIVMSLWRVPDEPTARLMTAFYNNLWNKRLPGAVALKQAQTEIAKTFKQPADWAGWILIGQGW